MYQAHSQNHVISMHMWYSGHGHILVKRYCILQQEEISKFINYLVFSFSDATLRRNAEFIYVCVCMWVCVLKFIKSEVEVEELKPIGNLTINEDS